MKRIIGYVKDLKGTFKAESKDGNVRLLKNNDPIYEDDAVFGTNEGTQHSVENSNITIELNDGRQVHLSEFGYLLFDASVMGKAFDFAGIDPDVNINDRFAEPRRHNQGQRDRENGRAESDENDDPGNNNAPEPDGDVSTTPFTTSFSHEGTPGDHDTVPGSNDNGEDGIDGGAETPSGTGSGIGRPSIDPGTPDDPEINIDDGTPPADEGADDGADVDDGADNGADDGAGDGTDDGLPPIVDTPPQAESSTIETLENGGPVSLGLQPPTDPDGDVLTITVTGLPVLGSVTLAAGTPVHTGDTLTSDQLTTVLYNAPADYDGVADPGDFTYGVTDGTQTVAGSVDIIVTPVNDPPVIDLDGDDSAGVDDNGYQTTFTENGSPVSIADIDSLITDVDDTNLETAVIVLTNAQAGDSLDVSGIPAGFTVVNSGIVEGQIIVTLTAMDTKANYADAVKAVKFTNSSETPVLTDRIIHVSVDDGETRSNTAVSTLHITPVDNPPPVDPPSPAVGSPVIDLDGDDSTAVGDNGYQTTFTENGAAVSIADLDSLITDTNDAYMESAVIVLINAKSGDSLDTTAVPGGFVITNSGIMGGRITVTLTATDTKTNYVNAIEAVKFANNLEDPDSAARVINVSVNDGDTDSNTAVSTIHITPVNDTPITDNVASSGDKNETYIAITLIGSDVDSSVSHFKVTSNPSEGTLYTDAALTDAVVIGSDIAASGNALTLYFKPDYGGANTYGPNNYNPAGDDVTFTFEAKDADSSDSITYGNSATATITVDDDPYAAVAVDKNVTENMDGATVGSVGGNVLTDGANFANGIDYQSTHGDNPVTVTMIQFTDSSGAYNVVVAVTTGTDEGGNDYSFNADFGKFTINNLTGDYTFIPNGSMDHGATGNDLDFKFKYAIEDDDGDLSNYAEQIIHIHDGAAPTIGTTIASSVDEENLSNGTNPDAPLLTKSADLDVTTGTDALDVTFDATQTALDTKITAGMSSGGHAISYIISNSGHTLTGVADGNDVFTVDITDSTNTGAGSGYRFTLIKPFDHEAGVTDRVDEIDLTFNVSATNDDDTTIDVDTDTFIVTVVDDSNGGAQAETTNEDSAITMLTSADGTFANTTINVPPPNGVVVVEADGKITYTPDSDFSGTETFTYRITNDVGANEDTTVTMTVNPISDAPIMPADISLNTNEDTQVAIGLTLPTIKDNIDGNGGTSGDSPERLGYLTLENIPTGGKLYLADGTTLKVTGDGGAYGFYITDASNFHRTDLAPGSDLVGGDAIIQLTTAEWQGLKYQPNANDGTDVDLVLKTTEYEVDGFGAKLAGVDGVDAVPQDIHIEVVAITDTFTLTKTGDASGDEDGWIEIGDRVTVGAHVDTDGSESFTFKVDGADLAVGSKYRVEHGAEQDASSGISVNNFIPGTTSIEIMTSTNDSNDINNLTISVDVVDSDADTSGAFTVNTQTVDIDVDVTPVANDLTVSGGGGSVNEDTQIDMGITFAGADGNEEIEYITIAGASIPTGAEIYASDGTTLHFTGDGATDFVIDITGQNPTNETIDDTLVGVSGYKIQPPQDSNTDFQLDVTIHTKDYDDDTSAETVTGSYNTTVNIEVIGVVDTSAGDLDTGDAGHLYVELGSAGGNAVTGDATVTDLGTVDEDNAFNLNAAWQSYEARTDGTGHTIATTDGSEKATFVIRNTTDTTDFSVTDGSGTLIGSRSSDGWHLTEAQIGSAHVKAVENFSGELNLELVTTVKESGDDSVFDENTQVDKFKITVNPITDAPHIAIREVFTKEDTPVKLDIRPISADMDGSESIVSFKIDNVPDGVVIKDASGDTLWFNNTGSIANHTFVIHSSTTTLEASGTDGSGSITLVSMNNMYFTPPAHSSGDIDLQISIKGQDGTASTVASALETLTVHIQGVADTPILQLEDVASGNADVGLTINGTDVVDTTQTFNDGETVVIYGQERTAGSDLGIPIALPNESGETLSLQTSTSPVYTHAAYTGDTSETLTFLLEGLPTDFRITDGAGNAIGAFVTLSGGTTTWALSSAEVSSGVYLKAPVDYSGTVTGLKYTTVVTEADGHSVSRELPFSLEVNPVITTADPIQDASGVEDAAPDGTNHGSLIDLDFGNVLDGTGSEIVTVVTVADVNIPTGLELFVLEAGNWVRADGLGIYSGGNYDLTNYVGKTAVGVVGGTLEHADGTFTITDVNVTVTDGNENGNTTTVTQNYTDDIAITLTGVADQPTITNASATSGIGNTHDISIATTFPDMDGSEIHYFTIATPGAGYIFNKGTMVDSNLWRFETGDLTGLQVEVLDDTVSTLTVKAYAAENGVEVDTATFDVTDTSGGTSSGGGHTPQTPTLVVAGTFSVNEDTAFTLSEVINTANTKLNDSDSGTEILSFVLRDLPVGATIISNNAAVQLDEITDTNGDTVYLFSGSTATIALSGITVTPGSNFSGDFIFTVEAVATETADPFFTAAKDGSANNINVHVIPVADTFGIDSSAMTTTIGEDSITQVKFTVSSSDTQNDANDLAEEVYYTQISSVDHHRLNVSGGGSFVYSNGNQIENDNSIIVKLDGGVARYDNETTWKDVYFKAPDQESGSYGINITSHTHDSTNYVSTASVVASESNSSTDQTQTISITVTSDPDAADETPDINATNDALLALDKATNEDVAVKLGITVTQADTDGSELQAIVITGLENGSIIQNSVGALIGTNMGNGSWKVESGDLNDLWTLPPENYSGTMHLNVANNVIESDDMSQMSSTSTAFTVTVNAIADGAITTPHSFNGNEDEYIHVNLEAESIEASQNATSPIAGTPAGNEHYKVVFDGINENVDFYWKDGSNVYHHLADENSSNAGDYEISNMTQEQVDNIYVVIGDNLSGTFNYGTHIYTHEVDGSNNVIDTSTSADGKVEITVDAVLGDDAINGTTGDDTLYGHSGNDTINGNDGDDTIYGGSGDDIIDGEAGADTIFGGTGDDTITFDVADTIDAGSDVDGADIDNLILGTGTSINFDAGVIAKLSNIEQIDLTQNGDHTIDNLTINDLIDITDSDNELTILGDGADTVNLENGDGGSWVLTETFGGFAVYDLSTDGNALTLKIDDDISHQII